MITENHSGSRPTIIRTERVRSEQSRKKFFIDRKENSRGQFIQITEVCNGHKNFVMLPMDAVEDVARALSAVAS